MTDARQAPGPTDSALAAVRWSPFLPAPSERTVGSGVLTLLSARQDGEDHADVGAELLHVGAQELLGGAVGDLAVVPEHLGEYWM